MEKDIIDTNRDKERELSPRDEAGNAHGKWLSYFKNGFLFYERNFVHGVENGLRREWWINGRIRYERPIFNGRVKGNFKIWHANGELRASFTQFDRLIEGEEVSFEY